MKKYYALASVVSLIALPLAACGSSDNSSTSSAATSASSSSTSSGGGTASTVDISTAPEGLAFEQKTVDAKAGDVTIDFDNPQPVPHDVCLEGPDGDIGCTDQISESKSSLTENLQPGDYTFYCSVPGHRDAGMEGTLTVK